ncbi:hypothetical protein K227x_40820 [Rubripirellula lacrimiformis]|uniref:Uncharacterized protein n=1 Tax=Rubripirellula lacrimiformis TaxID=1930273 RepID=A0A517NEX1_9BACT|nr:hypothetical protein K227x_40820 [Rubripirellula lacrimiformis]
MKPIELDRNLGRRAFAQQTRVIRWPTPGGLYQAASRQRGHWARKGTRLHFPSRNVFATLDEWPAAPLPSLGAASEVSHRKLEGKLRPFQNRSANRLRANPIQSLFYSCHSCDSWLEITFIIHRHGTLGSNPTHQKRNRHCGSTVLRLRRRKNPSRVAFRGSEPNPHKREQEVNHESHK